MDILLFFIIILITVLILYLFLFRKQDKKKPAAYICDQCGEAHCDCYLKGDIENTGQ
jgi:hypothetical protein